jgi:hypothetical protein
MKIFVGMIAAAAAVSAACAAAQPGKEDPAVKPPKPAAAAPVVLASAADVRQPSTTPAEASAQPSRRPAPRVTTCRCGDPQPAEEQPDQ